MDLVQTGGPRHGLGSPATPKKLAWQSCLGLSVHQELNSSETLEVPHSGGPGLRVSLKNISGNEIKIWLANRVRNIPQRGKQAR